MKRLGVNIDHVATLRNARNEFHPDPVYAAKFVKKSGANSITIHLREDRRHIRDEDLKIIKKKIRIPLNLEIAPTNEMLKIAIKHKPNYVCIVPEKRQELTTEGGLNLKRKIIFLKKMVHKLKKNKIFVCLFIEPRISDVKISKLIGANCVELHTGKFCNLFNNNKNTRTEFKNLERAANFAKEINLDVHAGHGLTFESSKSIIKIKSITEFNIGHFLVAESFFIGLKRTIEKFKKILKRN